jgi:peptidoglycan/LPS O-acetylase OafA/YrhL
VIHRIYRHHGAGALAHACMDFAPPAAWCPSAIVSWGMPCALLTLGCVSLEANGEWRRMWNLRTMQALGAASYSIYLIHPIGFANLDFYFLTYTGAVHRVGPDGAVLLLVALAAAAGISSTAS